MAKEVVKVGANSEEVEFYDPTALARAATKHESRLMWRGDHSRCAHSGGTCIAKRGWIFDADTLELRAHVVPVSIERRMMGTVQSAEKGAYPQPTQEAKGMVNWDPTLKVRPVPKLFEHHLQRYLADVKSTLKNDGAKHPEVKAELAERERLAREANGYGKKRAA